MSRGLLAGILLGAAFVARPAELPPEVAERIAWKNGETLFGGLLAR